MDKLYLVHGNTYYDDYGHDEHFYGVFTDRKTAEKVKKMASGEYVRVIRCKDCRCFIPLEDMKKCPEYKDYPFEAAEKVHADGICTNTDKWVYTSDFCSDARNSH